MRFLVLSDIHANIDALETVIESASAVGFDRLLVLGDLVGYGAEPNLVIDRLRALEPLAIIRGNHDKVAAGIEGPESFNPVAQRAARWTREALTEVNRDYLRGLDRGPVEVDALTEICHGSPMDEDAYLFAESDVVESLLSSTRPVCLFGHTHLPMAAALAADRRVEILFQGPRDRQAIALERDRGVPDQPGSVGQPRDGDPRAAYALLDTDSRSMEVIRTVYPVQIGVRPDRRRRPAEDPGAEADHRQVALGLRLRPSGRMPRRPDDGGPSKLGRAGLPPAVCPTARPASP